MVLRLHHLEWYPKGGDFYQVTIKPSETVVEVGPNADVQIAYQNLTKGRKTHRTTW